MMMSKLEINVTPSDRKLTSTSSKGDQLKWYKNGIWIKADNFGYEGLAEYFVSCLLSFSNLSRL